MATKKIIELITKLDDKGLEELERGLQKVDTQQKNVSKSSDEAAKGLKKVGDNGGAIATLDALTGGLATRIRDAAEASKLFNINLKATRTALIATGIGAFVVALGVVVSYWDEIVDYITGANKLLQQQIDIQNKIIKRQEFELELLEAKEKVLIAEGKSTEEIRKQKIKVIELQLQENDLLLEKLETQLKTEQAQTREVTLWEKIKIGALQAAGALDAVAKARAESIVGNEEERARLDEIAEQIQESRLRAEALKLSLIQANTIEPTDADSDREKVQSVGSPRTAEEQAEVLAKKQQQFEEVFNLEKLQQEQLNQLGKDGIEEALNDSSIAEAQKRKDRKITDDLIKKMQEEELAREKILNEQKLALTQDTLGKVTQILGENTAVGKAAGIALATINTYQGVTEVLGNKTTLPEPFGTINKIASTALILKNGFDAVKNISKTPIPSVGASSGGGATASAQPSFNVVGTSGVNQLSDALQQEQQPIQAYVVGSQVTTQQELDNNIVNTATIG